MQGLGLQNDAIERVRACGGWLSAVKEIDDLGCADDHVA
jgi:hypothetical protein